MTRVLWISHQFTPLEVLFYAQGHGATALFSEWGAGRITRSITRGLALTGGMTYLKILKRSSLMRHRVCIISNSLEYIHSTSKPRLKKLGVIVHPITRQPKQPPLFVESDQ